MPPLPPPPPKVSSKDINLLVESIIHNSRPSASVRSKNVQRQSSVPRSAIDVLHASRVTRATSPTFQPYDPKKGDWMG